MVTPPCRVESIQPSWFCRGVQSPDDGVDVAVDQAGRDDGPLRVDDGRRALGVDVLRAARPRDPPSTATIVSASRIGLSIAPDSRRPMLRINVLPGRLRRERREPSLSSPCRSAVLGQMAR